MPRDPRVGIKIDAETWKALERAMQRAQELDGVPYGSVSDFILDALRERVRAVNEAWRDEHSLPPDMGTQEKRKKKEGER